MKGFAHVHGFYSQGAFVPREASVATVEAEPHVRGTLFDIEDYVFNMKDIRANNYASRMVSGLHFPPRRELPRPRAGSVDDRITRLLEDFDVIYVKGSMQLLFFETFSDVIVNLDDENRTQIPRLKDLIQPPFNIDVLHCEKYHIDSLRHKCTFNVSCTMGKYLHHINPILDDEDIVEEWWDI